MSRRRAFTAGPDMLEDSESGKGRPICDAQVQLFPPRVEAIMRATGLVSITLAIMVLAATDAGAASWCAFYTGKALGGSENCGFATIEQCLAQVRGLGGWCRPNPFPGTAFGTAGTWGSGPPRQSRGGYQSQ
jgi:hypothetical protein